MAKRDDPHGPYIRWIHFGYEGWRPKSYDTVKEALIDENYGNDFVITKIVDYEVKENA